MVPNGDLQVGFLKTFVINQHLNDRKLEIDREEFEYRRNNMRLIFNGIELKDDERKINEIFTSSGEEEKVHCGIAVIPRVLSTKEKEEKEEEISDKTTTTTTILEQKEEKEEEKTETMTESDLANLQQLQIQALSQIDQWRQRAQYFEIIDPTESARARSLSRDWENRLSELNNIAWASYHQMMSGMMPDSVITNNNNTTVENQQQETPVENGENNRRFAYQILIFIDIRLLLKLGLLVLILSQDGGKERMLFLIACACIVYMYQTRLFELLFRGRIGNDENAAQQQERAQQQQQQQQQQQEEEEPSIFSSRGIREHFRSHFIAGVIRRNTDEWWERIYDLAYIVLGFALSFLPMWRPHVSEDDDVPFVPVAAPDEHDLEEKVDETEERGEKVDETEEREEKVDEIIQEEGKVQEDTFDETEHLLPSENKSNGNDEQTGLRRRRRPQHNDSF